MAARMVLAYRVTILLALLSGCAARPLTPPDAQQRQQLSILGRTAHLLQVQLASVQSKLQNIVDSVASPSSLPSSALEPARRQSLRAQPAPAATLAGAPTAATAREFVSLASASASDPLLPKGYQPLTSAATISRQTAAERHAVAISETAANLYKHTFNPAATKGAHRTVLLTPAGDMLTKDFTWDGPPADVDLKAIATTLTQQPGEGFDAQSSAALTSQLAVGCDGCVGGDDRVAVSTTAAARFPYTAIGMMTATLPPSANSANAANEWCTGAIVSPRHVLTAAHCVWDVQETHTVLQSIQFSAGRDSAATPFGTVPYTAVRLLSQFQSAQNYSNTATNTDFAVITLASPVGKKTGWFGLDYSTAADEQLDIATAGYPDDKPMYTMWSTTCNNTNFQNDDPNNHVVTHTCDSTHGQSGAPMYTSDNNVRAILTGGNGSGFNWGIKLDAFVFSTILGWMQEDGEFTNVGAAIFSLGANSG